jgi:hypothetical protein
MVFPFANKEGQRFPTLPRHLCERVDYAEREVLAGQAIFRALILGYA